MIRELSLVIVAAASTACEPDLNVGVWACASSTGPAGTMPDGSVVSIKDPVPIPWQDGFEDGFCGYRRAKGFCYTRPDASYSLSEAPVHSGHRAARFSVTADQALDGKQTRCVREGTMPLDAVYGAWFFVSAAAAVGGNWNLMYFNGGTEDGLPAQWDVSLGDGDGGPLKLHLLNHLTDAVLPDPTAPDAGVASPTVPIGAWFHVEFRYLRAQSATGRVALYQNGVLIVESKDIQTEGDNVTWGQWYVGNLVDRVTPADSTVYVDDVSITPPP